VLACQGRRRHLSARVWPLRPATEWAGA